MTVEDNKNFIVNVKSLLLNEEFIQWRLLQSEELNEYWSNFRAQNPHLAHELDEAIIKFEEVKINHFPLSSLEKQQIHKNIHCCPIKTF